MKRKGFTLIELLAVIVILALIALIATPIILNIIDDSKKEAAKVSAQNYFDAVELAIANKNTKGQFDPSECTISDETKELNCKGNFDKVHCGGEVCTELSFKVKIYGEEPTNGTIIFKKGRVANETTITIGGSSLIKNKNKIEEIKEEDVIVGKFNSVCELASDSIIQGYEAGAKYNCKVDPNKDTYAFYVLKTPSTGSTTIDLIMNQNIYNDGTPVGMDEEITQEMNSNKYNAVNWNNESTQSDGPVTVLKFLNKATKSWTNLKPLNYEYKDKELQSLTTSGYDSLVINNGNVLINGNKLNLESLMYARIPIFLENDSVNTEISYLTETNEYLYDNLSSFCYSCEGPFAYWTLSTYSSISLVNGAYSINGYGSAGGNSIDSTTNVGVRPVITLDI